MKSPRKPLAQPAPAEFLAFDDVSIGAAPAPVFRHSHWAWRRGEQWAMLGPDGSGKSLFVQAVLGRVPVIDGEVRGPHPVRADRAEVAAPLIAHVSPQTQRDVAEQESSFYQLRWHNSLEQGPRTVAEFLSQRSIEERNPFEVGSLAGNARDFSRRQRQFVEWLGIRPLWRRRLIHLSNGEMRRTLLVAALLKAPDLLILEDAYAGLDAATRRKLAGVITRLMRDRWPVLVVTNRVEEIPAATTHLLLLDNHQIFAQGPKAPMLRLWRRHFGGRGIALKPKLQPCNRTRSSPSPQPSPSGRGRMFDCAVKCSPSGESRRPSKSYSLSLEERTRVRGKSASNRIVPARATVVPRAAMRQGSSGSRPLVELRNVTVRGARRRILHDLTWTLRAGECWALLGPNGAGKTTLLNLIQGDHPQAYSQDIRLFGRRTDSTQVLWQARQRIGWMSPELHQHYPPGWTAEAVVCSGFFNSIGLHQPCSRRQRAKARQWLVDLGLGRNTDTRFGELSFGRQRLVLLARSAVKQPRLLILDEPCQGLDLAQRRALLSAVDRVVARTSAALIFVTHHPKEVPDCVSRVLRLWQGGAA